LTQAEPGLLGEPDHFEPERFAHGRKQEPFPYVAVSAEGPRLLHWISLWPGRSSPGTGASPQNLQLSAGQYQSGTLTWAPTLEPEPGVFMRVGPPSGADRPRMTYFGFLARFLIIPLLVSAGHHRPGLASGQLSPSLAGSAGRLARNRLHILLGAGLHTPWG